MKEFAVRPNPEDPRLTRKLPGLDQEGQRVETTVVVERPLTLFFNGQEIVTMMTVGDHPDYLAVGYLLNQNMLRSEDTIPAIDYDDDLETIVVRTKRKTDFEKKLRKKTLTSGCAQGTAFGDLMERFDDDQLDPQGGVARPRGSMRCRKKINTVAKPLSRGRGDPWLRAVRGGPAAGLYGGCRPAQRDRQDRRLYAPDTASSPQGKIFYTTGRLTSEMVIKTVQMGIPILISRSGFTAWGVELARQAGLTLIGRAKGKRFMALAGREADRLRHRPASASKTSRVRRNARPRSRTRFDRCRRRSGRRAFPPHGRRRQIAENSRAARPFWNA